MKARTRHEIPAIITPSAGDTSLPGMVQLGNGVPVYLVGNATADLLRVEFGFRAGQAMEDVHLSASTANAMLTEGTLNHDAETINDLIDSTGAILNHHADKDSAGLITVTLARKLDEVMALAGEVLFTPSFPENEFRLLTDRRVQSYLTGRQKTSIIAREVFYEALCGSHNPYGRITEESDYRSLRISDLRLFHEKHYRPGNMLITVAGREPERALPVLERYFGHDNGKGWVKPELPPLLFESSKPGRIFREVHSPVQSTVRMGWRGITRTHPDYLALQVATMILGGYFGSRLMRNIREDKGYTYGIHAVAGAFRDIGYITLMTDVANEYRDATLNEIIREIETLMQVEAGEDEMTLVRNHMMGEIARIFDGPFSVAEAIKGVIEYEAGADYYTRLVETVSTITPSEIRKIFQTYFSPDEAYIIIAGAR